MITLEPYQVEAVEWLAKHRRGIVKIGAGGGKTIVAAAALDRVIGLRQRSNQVRVGWMCNTKEQGEQALLAISHFPRLLTHNVIVACAASARDWSDRDVLVADEVHHGTANGWSAQIATCKGALWGFTATPETGDDERDSRLFDLFDRNIFEVDRQRLMGTRLVEARVVLLHDTDDCGEALERMLLNKFRLSVRWNLKQIEHPGFKKVLWDKNTTRQTILDWAGKCHDLPHAVADRIKYQVGDSYKAACWRACIKIGIVGNVKRNQKIVDLARMHQRDHTIILCNEVEHTNGLAAQIDGAVACYSAMGDKKRREAVAAFKSGACPCIVATTMFDEGADFPIANVLIMASAGRSQVKTEQRTGRVLRSFHGKEHGLIYDFTDRAHPLMQRHGEKRLALYRELGYQVVEAAELALQN